jgi:hypothetical protein
MALNGVAYYAWHYMALYGMIWHGNERSKNRNIMRLNTFGLDMLDNVGHVGLFLQPM